MKRYGSIIGVRAEKLEEYKKLHAAVWPEVLRMIKRCNIKNYSIFLRRMPDGNYYLFSYFEYVGSDFKADMKKMADDPATQRWWKETDPCQQPLRETAAKKQIWTPMEEVFHTN